MRCSYLAESFHVISKALSSILIKREGACGEVECTKFGFLMMNSQLNIQSHFINLKSFLVVYLDKIWKPYFLKAYILFCFTEI